MNLRSHFIAPQNIKYTVSYCMFRFNRLPSHQCIAMEVALIYGGMNSYIPCTSLFTAEPTQYNGPMIIGFLPEAVKTTPFTISMYGVLSTYFRDSYKAIF